jgi:peptidoglycan/xylan/chitin deacetylase (PgdA/CDA1 family)
MDMWGTRARRVLLLAACLIAPGAVAVAEAGASSPPAAPLAVTSASLRQDGQQLVWQVQLAHAFAPDDLKRAGRTLCLQLAPLRRGAATRAVCVGSTRDHRHAALYVRRVTGSGLGPAHALSATIARSSSRELSASFTPPAAGLSYESLRWQVRSTLATPPCTGGASTCTAAYPARPALARLHTPRLVGCVPSGPSYVTNGSRRRKVVALTFDDGPWPDTAQFLDILERNHVPATFFQIGEQVSTYGRSVDMRMLRDGDMIGDHTWNHADVAGDGPFAAGEIARTRDAIRALTGFTPCLFRAPYGAVSPALIREARSMGFTTIEWDVDPRDWSLPGSGAIYSTVVNNARNGSIILQHDGGGNRSETLAALQGEISTLRHRGFGFVTVTQLLGQRLIYR